MITVETYANLPRKLGHHAFIVLALLQAARMMRISPVNAQWIYDHAPGYGINSISAALRKLCSHDIQLAKRVTGGWVLNGEAFQLPLGSYLVPENHSQSDSDNKTTGPDPDENHSQSDSDNKTTGPDPDENHSQSDFDPENHSQSDSDNKTTGPDPDENHSQSDFDPENHSQSDSRSLKLIKRGGGGDKKINSDPPPLLRDWEKQNKKMLEHTPLLFGDGFEVLSHGLDLDAIPPAIVRGWLNEAYFLMGRGRYAPNMAAGVVYNRLRDYPQAKPKPKFLNVESDAYLPESYLVEIGILVKVCHLCEAEFETMAAYEEHAQKCVNAPENWKRQPEPVDESPEPDETIDDRIVAAWERTLEQVRAEMPRASFETWVKDAEPLHFSKDRLIIGVRNNYAREWCESRLVKTCERLIAPILGERIAVDFRSQ